MGKDIKLFTKGDNAGQNTALLLSDDVSSTGLLVIKDSIMEFSVAIVISASTLSH